MLANSPIRMAWMSLCLVMGLSCASRAGGAPPEFVDPGHSILRVLVVEQENGRPIPGVSVNLQVEARSEEMLDREFAVACELERRSVSTDANGAAEFVLRLQRDYYVDGVVHELGDVRFSGTVTPAALGSLQEVRVEVSSVADRVVRGRITNLRGATPVAGALVSRVSYGSNEAGEPVQLRRRRIDSVQADADGRFVLRVPSLDATSLSVEAAGYVPSRVTIMPPRAMLMARAHLGLGAQPPASAAAPELDIDVVLEPSPYVPVRVLDVAGVPQAGVEVAVQSIENVAGWSPCGDDMSHSQLDLSYFGVTDDSGVCTVPARLLSFYYRIDLARDGSWLASAMTMNAHRPRTVEEITLRIGAPQTIRGRALTPEGRPVAGTELWLSETWAGGSTRFVNPDRSLARTTTAADGSFSFEMAREPLLDWEWIVGPPYRRVDTLRVDPAAVAPASERVPRGANRELLPVDVTIWRGHYIGGRALARDGLSAAKRVLILRAADASVAHGAVVMNDGSFLFGPLVPGDYFIESQGNAEWASLTAITASTGDLDVRLPFMASAGLRVALHDGTGALRTDVQIDLWPHEEPAAFDAEPSSAYREPENYVWEDRRLHFLGLAAGRWDLLVHCRGDETVAAATVDLTAGGLKELELSLQPAATLLLVNPKHGSPARLALRVDEGMIERFELAAGARTEYALPAGVITLLVDGAKPSRHSLSLAPGQRAEFELP